MTTNNENTPYFVTFSLIKEGICYQCVDKVTRPYALRMYGGEFSIKTTKTPEGKPYLLMNMPYYLGTKIPQYVEYFVENHEL